MNLLVLDGNSIVNRAFYGIKLLTTKSGYYTNAIYGFLNILLKLQDTCHPDGVAVAFDVHEPTFRHKQYADYKAGRKPMPQELRAQMPVLKELLTALGYTTVECPGWGRRCFWVLWLPLAETAATPALLPPGIGTLCSWPTAG